jgi:hypothetical protein
MSDVQASAKVSSATRSKAPGRRRELGPLQDQALYNCQCGFVFEAPVSTSVGCPNCGDTQAW